MKPVEIRFNKLKTVLFLTLCIAAFIISWNLLTNPEHFISHRYKISFFIRITGLLATIFCGIGIIYFVKTLLYKKPAIRIDERGIEENTSIMSVGLIDWEDITGITEGKVNSNRFITIHIKNEKKYFSLSKNKLQTFLMKQNMKYYRSPFHINTNALNCKHDELKRVLLEFYAIYGRI